MPIKILVEIIERKSNTIQIEMSCKGSKTKPTNKEIMNASMLCSYIDMVLRTHARTLEGVEAAYTPEDIDTLKGMKDLEESEEDDK